jgi:hypothetical protein
MLAVYDVVECARHCGIDRWELDWIDWIDFTWENW